MTSEAHGYDAGLESLLEALSTTKAGLTDEEVGAALGTRPTARRINARLGNAFAALRDAVNEPIREGHAVRREGPARTRRWHPGEKLERVRGALRRAWWGAQTRASGHVRAAARIAEAARYPTMEVRTMRIAERSIEFENGARGLTLALDEAVFDHSDARRGEVHVQHYRDAAREDPYDSSAPQGLEWSGERVRGREDEVDEGNWNDALEHGTARIAEGVWMQRWLSCEGDPYELATELAAEPVDWSEWAVAEGAAVTRWVRWVCEAPMPGRSEWLAALRRAPPVELRYRAHINALAHDNGDGVRVLPTITTMRGATLEAAERAFSQALETGRIAWGWCVGPVFYTENGERAEDPDGPATQIPPEARRRCAWRDLDGGYRFPSAEEDLLAESAEYHTEAGWIERALEINRRRVALHPWDLDALEDLAMAHKALGHRDEYDALRNETMRRGLSMLPADFAWEAGALDWLSHENRPFLRACFRHAVRDEHFGRDEAALAMWDRLARASRSDGMGARYEGLRMAVKLARWRDAAGRLRALAEADDASAESAFAEALCAHALGEGAEADGALGRAAARHPLVASRIMQHERAPCTDKWCGYTVGGFSEAEYYWARYHEAWQAPEAEPLRRGLARARSASGRSIHVRRTPSIFNDTGAIEANMTRYRAAIGTLEAEGVRHCDELWDLLREIEAGGAPAQIGREGDEATIGWHGSDGTRLRVVARGAWRATATVTTDDGREMTIETDFGTIAKRWGEIAAPAKRRQPTREDLAAVFDGRRDPETERNGAGRAH